MKYLMNLMYNHFFTVLFISSLFSLFVFDSLPAQTPHFEELKSKFETGLIFSAEFRHQYNDAFTGEQTVTEGRIWIGKEKYRIEADNQVMVVDGDLSKVYNRTRDRLIISPYVEEEDDYAPSRMLQGVDDSYNVSEKTGNSGNPVIILENEDPFAVFERVEISLDSEGLPLEIEATDQAENRLVTQFNNGMFDEQKGALFEIEVSGSAEIIDLRHESP